MSSGTATLNQGTTVEVKDLFYNTPARFKYIKSDLAEKNQIIDIFDRLALAHPEIRFELNMDGKRLKETYGNGDFYQLIDRIYGPKMTKDMVTFKEIVQKIKIEGYLLSPHIMRSRKKDISIFVNGRYIKNYALVQAVIDGYHSFMMVGKYPIALIHIDIDPSLLDCNVHPQKYEVKFVNEMVLAYHIEGFVKQALLMSRHEIPETMKDIDKTYQHEEIITPLQMTFDEINERKDVLEEEQKMYQKLPEMDYVGTFAGTYLIFQNEDGMYLVDQHAAQERVRYEHYYNALQHPKKARKLMLFSYELKLKDEDFNIMKEHVDAFEELGFIFNDALELTAIPTWLREEEIQIAIDHMVAMLEEQNKIELIKLRDALAKDISCKGAIKANQALALHEIESLMEQLKVCENPYHCPHGRPTIIKLSHYDVERMFKRVV
jgi:DNA mismatch repair protein MutL